MSLSRILIFLAVLIPVAATGVAEAKTSHVGWPRRTGVLRIAANHDTIFRGTHRNDELLGGHGNDTLIGGAGGDVLWGDQHPTGNTTLQHDTMIGGPGRDFIYASHGRNDIDAGSGNDVIHAHFGTGGVIDCGSGYDVVYISHRSRRHYRLIHCERVSYFTLGY
jgi:hypothetical protein